MRRACSTSRSACPNAGSTSPPRSTRSGFASPSTRGRSPPCPQILSGRGRGYDGRDGAPRIELVRGDITDQAVDAIVNAANTALRPGGGVDGAITRAAGTRLRSSRERRGSRSGATRRCATGDAVATTAASSPPAGSSTPPDRSTPASDRDPELLASCHTSSLRVADELGARSVAFPAISTRDLRLSRRLGRAHRARQRWPAPTRRSRWSGSCCSTERTWRHLPTAAPRTR